MSEEPPGAFCPVRFFSTRNFGDERAMDVTDGLRYLGALALVLALVGIAGLALRRYGLPGVGGPGRRLQIVETLMLNKSHRVVIMRCDGTEHVLVTTPQGATVIATGLSGIGTKPAGEKPIGERPNSERPIS
jgi:flagellar protein FliO/FliZ